MSDQGTAITSITYIINPALLRRFQAKQEELRLSYGQGSPDSSYVLAFHGTTLEKAHEIIMTNFRLDKLGSNTGNQGCYGAGIYFSEFVGTSKAYGTAVLLCRLLPGRSYDINQQQATLGSPLTPGYDSHRVAKDHKGRGQELVIFNVDQILPCYLIQFRY